MQVKNDWKLYKNEDSGVENSDSNEQTVSLDALSKLTGFPVEFIKAELFLNELKSSEPIPLANLRSHMLKFLKRSMAKENSLLKEAIQ